MSDAAQGALVRLTRLRPVEAVGPSLRARARQTLPLAWRIALRRLPAIVGHVAQRFEGGPPRARDRSAWGYLQAERTSPLRRPGAAYEPRLQRAKEANVRRAVAALDGAVVAPGELFSWHRYVGPPLRVRGFCAGPELHGDALGTGTGGGVCQVSNLVYYLALHCGAQIVERHRHHLDLFPDANRDVPFGCGATVFYPRRDLRFINALNQPLLLALEVRGGSLCGQVRLLEDPGRTWDVVETDHRFVRRAQGVWRENRLIRRETGPDGTVRNERIADNRARVTYPVPAEEIEPG